MSASTASAGGGAGNPQAESVIRNIIREICLECSSQGQNVTETLAAFMVSERFKSITWFSLSKSSSLWYTHTQIPKTFTKKCIKWTACAGYVLIIRHAYVFITNK